MNGGSSMLIKKPKYQLIVRDPSSSETTNESIRNWVRKLEQTTQSISSRLAAVEKRFSLETRNCSENPCIGAIPENSFEHVSDIVKKEKKNKHIKDIQKFFDQELLVMQETLCSQNQEIITLKEQLAVFHQFINEVTQKMQQVQHDETRSVEKITDRVDSLEHRMPVAMKLGRFEIPVEVTGVIGGILAFVIAVLVVMNQNAVVLSPWFLVGIGFLLLGSTIVKTVHVGSTLVKPWKTRNAEPLKICEK